MAKPGQKLRPLGDVIDYLHGLGFDHLYLSSPSSRGQAGRGATRAQLPRATERPGQSYPSTRSPTTPSRSPARSASSGPSRSSAGHTVADSSPAGSAGRRSASPSSTAGGEKAPPSPGATSSPISEIATPSSPEERFARYDEVERQAQACKACRLCEGRRNVVFGSGKIGSQLMFIGEGPGAEEDRQGLPFVGPAGALLTRIIEAIQLRREDVYIANMVKCRPPGNRDPEADEIAACRPYLEAQIDLVQPKLIVVLGRVAAQALLQTTSPLGKLRDQWHSVRGLPARATYHPAALLRYEKYKRPTWEDMKAVRDRLAQL